MDAIQNRTGVTSKTSAVETKKSPKGIKRKLSPTIEGSPVPGKFVLMRKNEETPEKQETNQTKRLEQRFKIDESAVKSAFEGVQKLLEEEAEQYNRPFNGDQAIFLQVTSVKVPKCPPRVARLSLKHSFFTDDSDICFIAVDTPETGLEEIKDYYETLFASKGVNNIKTIIPISELQAEYEEYELKRRLVEQYDVFLVERRLSHKVSRCLDGAFYEKRKLPALVKFDENNVQRNIKKALLKTPFHIHANGNRFIVQVCHSGMTDQQKIANFWAVVQGIDKEFPGHWENVRSLNLKGATTTSVPVYMNLKIETEVLRAKQDYVESVNDSDEENEGDEENTETEEEEIVVDYYLQLMQNQKKKKTPAVKNKKEKLIKEKNVVKHKKNQKKFAKRNTK